jgi:serine/threonine protein kinase/tetratricopeptide (TPR) repeat protein
MLIQTSQALAAGMGCESMIGRTLSQFRVVEELGAGGMGTVYRAEDTRLGRDVALKVLANGRSVSEGDAGRFLKEARAAAALRHPNICTVYDVGEDDGVRYIAMSYIPGRSLREILDAGTIPLDETFDIVNQMARGLRAAHESGIVHRDIKPGNVIVDDAGRVTILDFGIAKLSGHATDTGDQRAVGTVGYMSPEQASGESVDQRTDIWSLGVCLFEMVAGTVPFKGEHDSAVIYQIINQDPPSWASLGVEISRSLARVICKAMEKKPKSRYQSVDEMLDDLERARIDMKRGKGAEEPSVAVLPFTNMSADAEQTYFCEGMAEEVINSLAQVDGLRVVSRTSSFAYRDCNVDIREIGRRLGVDAILEGSVQKSASQLRITAQLINVSDGYHMWSQRYDRDLEDIYVIQDEIACSIVQALEVTLTDKEREVIERVPTTDMKAYDFYMRGLHHYHEMDKRGLETARNMFTSVIIRDPAYALAYCGLADCYSMFYTFYDNDPSIVENALTASEKALELEPDLAQAHASQGLALSLDGRFDDAEREFAVAVELRPKLFEAYYYHARACRAQGRLEQAAALFDKAAELRPEDYEAPILAGDTYRGLDMPGAMRASFERGLLVAQKHIELHPLEARAWYLGAHAYFALEDRENALEWNQRAMELGPRDPATLYNAACLFCLTGEVDRCFECFNLAVENGFSNLRWLENDPDLAGVREDPRYLLLLKDLSAVQ